MSVTAFTEWLYQRVCESRKQVLKQVLKQANKQRALVSLLKAQFLIICSNKCYRSLAY